MFRPATGLFPARLRAVDPAEDAPDFGESSKMLQLA
jgi:hypothetical protein